MQNPIPKFRQSPISWENRLFVWKIENFDELQLPEGLVYFAEVLQLNNV